MPEYTGKLTINSGVRMLAKGGRQLLSKAGKEKLGTAYRLKTGDSTLTVNVSKVKEKADTLRDKTVTIAGTIKDKILVAESIAEAV